MQPRILGAKSKEQGARSPCPPLAKGGTRGGSCSLVLVSCSFFLGCVHHAVPVVLYPPPAATLLPCPQLPVPAVTTKDPVPQHRSAMGPAVPETMPIDFMTALHL